MKEMTLKEIQKMSLRILKDVDEFCQRYQINYSLGYGALIGAIRHKGFIPWDDDIDIIMTRKEYNRFISCFSGDKTIESKGLKLFAPELGNCYFNTARVCDIVLTRVQRSYQWTNNKTGVWLDLFVLDPLPQDGGKELIKQSQLLFRICCATTPLSSKFNFTRNIKIIARRLKYSRYNKIIEINNYLHMLEYLPEYDNPSIAYVCNLSSPYRYIDIHKKTVFERYIRVPFEDLEVSVIADYDEYLKTIYGDYMELPPLSKRKRGHTDNKYYWK